MHMECLTVLDVHHHYPALASDGSNCIWVLKAHTKVCIKPTAWARQTERGTGNKRQ